MVILGDQLLPESMYINKYSKSTKDIMSTKFGRYVYREKLQFLYSLPRIVLEQNKFSRKVTSNKD